MGLTLALLGDHEIHKEGDQGVVASQLQGFLGENYVDPLPVQLQAGFWSRYSHSHSDR